MILKQQWVPEDGATSLDGDTWIEEMEGDTPGVKDGGWYNDADSYYYDSEGNKTGPAPSNKTMSQIQGRYDATGEPPTYEDWVTAWQIENPDVAMKNVPDEDQFNKMWAPFDVNQAAYDLPLDDPRHPNYIQNTTGPRQVGQIDDNNNGVPDYLEPGMGPVTPMPTVPLQTIPTTTPPITAPTTVPVPPMSPSTPLTMEELQQMYEEDGTIPDYDIWSEAWRNKNPGVPVPDRATFDQMFSPPDPNNLPITDPLHPDYVPSNVDPTTNIAKPKQTIKDLLDSMGVNKELFQEYGPDMLAGAGHLFKGLGPLATTLKVGQDKDEVNYFKDMEDASISDIEKGMNVLDQGKEEARRVIERQARQGKLGLSDYVMSAQQRRGGERALDIAAMEQIPLSDLRFDTQKSQLYQDIANKRFQGDFYDYTGETDRDKRLDENRDNYYSNISENLSNLGTEMQGFAKNLNQKKVNELREQAYLENIKRGNLAPGETEWLRTNPGKTPQDYLDWKNEYYPS